MAEDTTNAAATPVQKKDEPTLEALNRLLEEATPGPWLACTCGKCALVFGGDRNTGVACAPTHETFDVVPVDEKTWANARLIAAAPTLARELHHRLLTEQRERDAVREIVEKLRERAHMLHEIANAASDELGERGSREAAHELDDAATTIERRWGGRRG